MGEKLLKRISNFKWDPQNLFLDKDFLLLWFSQLLTAIAASVFGIALAILSDVEGLGSNYQDSAFGVALILFFTNMPGLFVSVFAGVIADWYDRKKIMVIVTILRFVFSMVFLIFQGWENAAIAYAIIFLKSAATQVYMPSQASIIPDIINKNNILLANSVFNLTNYSTTLLGIVGAGAFIKLFGEEHTFLALGSMFLIGAIFIPFIRIPKRKLHLDGEKFLVVVKDFLKSTIEGFRYISKGAVQKFALVHNFLTTSVLLTIVTIIFKLTDYLIKIDAEDVGLTTILPLLIGVILSVLILNTIVKNSNRISIIHGGVILAAVSFTIIAFLTTLRFNEPNLVGSFVSTIETFDLIILSGTIVALVIIGLAFPLLIIPAQTLIHEDTESEFRGRVFGVWFAVNQALATIPAMLIGLLADSSLGLPTTMTVLAILIIIYSVVLVPFRKLA